jgi:hypothetical protein
MGPARPLQAIWQRNPLVNGKAPAAVGGRLARPLPVNNVNLIQIALFGILRELSSNNRSIISSIERCFT